MLFDGKKGIRDKLKKKMFFASGDVCFHSGNICFLVGMIGNICFFSGNDGSSCEYVIDLSSWAIDLLVNIRARRRRF